MYIGIDKEITIPVDYKDLIKDPSALIVLCLSIHYRLLYLDCLIGMDYNSLLPKLNVESESESQRIKEKPNNLNGSCCTKVMWFSRG